MKNLHSFLCIWVHSRRPRLNSQIEYFHSTWQEIGCVTWPSLEKEYYPFFQNIFLADNAGNIVHYKQILTGNSINNCFFKKKIRNPNESLVNIRIFYQCVFLKYFLQLMLRIVILYPTSFSSNAFKNNVACYGRWRSFTSCHIDVSDRKCFGFLTSIYFYT